MRPIIDRFLSYVDKTPGHGPNGDCWIWTGGRDRDGYGQSSIRGKRLKAHRMAYHMFSGIDPIGKVVCHTCDYPPCVNPDHLFIGTTQDNTADRDAKKRQARGERQGFSKLTKDIVIAIREMAASGIYQYVIAEKFGLAQSHVSRIVRRESWHHI